MLLTCIRGFICVIHVSVMLGCISFSYSASATFSHFESSSWSSFSMQVVKGFIVLLGDECSLFMSLNDVLFPPILVH